METKTMTITFSDGTTGTMEVPFELSVVIMDLNNQLSKLKLEIDEYKEKLRAKDSELNLIISTFLAP